MGYSGGISDMPGIIIRTKFALCLKAAKAKQMRAVRTTKNLVAGAAA